MADETKRRTGKRGHGEGTISQRRDGRWIAQVMVGYKPDGKPDRRTVYGKTRAECQAKLDQLRKRASGGLLTEADKERSTVAAYLDQWLAAIAGAVRASTVDRYSRLVRLHLAPGLGRHRLTALKPDSIQAFYSAKLAAGLSPTTVQLLHTTLHKAFEDAVEWNYLPYNPVDRVRRPRRARFEAKPPTPNELAALLHTAEDSDDRLATLWTLKAHTGARLGELLGLSWLDMDLARGTMSLRRGLTGILPGGEPILDELKTTPSRRVVSLPEEAVVALRHHRARQAEERLKLGDGYRDYGLVFAPRLGTTPGERNVERAFKLALKRAGLRSDIRLHDLRHAHATTLGEAGVNLKTISTRLGHASIQITADLYMHPTQDADREAGERFARALRDARG